MYAGRYGDAIKSELRDRRGRCRQLASMGNGRLRGSDGLRDRRRVMVFVKCGNDGRWRLWIRSVAGESPAGLRLNRGGMFPYETLYDHQDYAQATIQAGRLQEYIDDRQRALTVNRKKKHKWN